MAIDVSAIGTVLPPLTVTVERGRLRFFAHVTGQVDPVYRDLAVAHAHGYPDLPVPPTFLFGLELERPEPFAWLDKLGVDLRHVLHGEQSFTYHAMAYANDVLILSSKITDIYSKKGGALEFIERTTEVHRSDSVIATLEQVIIVRNPGASS